MSVILRTGIAALTFALKHAYEVLLVYGDKLDKVIDQAVTDGKITSAQAAELKAFLAGLAAAVLIVRTISGY